MLNDQMKQLALNMIEQNPKISAEDLAMNLGVPVPYAQGILNAQSGEITDMISASEIIDNLAINTE